MTPMAFILRFTFSHPDMHTNIVGTVNPAYLQDNIDALLQGPLPPDVYAEAKRDAEQMLSYVSMRYFQRRRRDSSEKGGSRIARSDSSVALTIRS